MYFWVPPSAYRPKNPISTTSVEVFPDASVMRGSLTDKLDEPPVMVIVPLHAMEVQVTAPRLAPVFATKLLAVIVAPFVMLFELRLRVPAIVKPVKLPNDVIAD